MTISGVVIKGKQRGKALGFPTANIPVKENVEQGIYISKTKVENNWFNSITFIGIAKTFDDSSFQAETYLLEFSQDLYGRKIEIELIKKIRDNKKFRSTEELIKQMNKDKKEAEVYFNSKRIKSRIITLR
ncbi:MAG: hypothetical protein A3F31_03570 [Candidatus Levybacteria bacterium RIFCSPHIGHO2_12_FULL_38_12]|nr:MAG: hypothetical protein A2770_00130 [Candidatus Levybacteria bacterium RIFCSPHIGHO2_01_FULL_38_12]OGH22366.1 MAG: hypothetical protein A3D75_01775 [Candidatus Levybacteria bacterium RIFCSPHIGHO2_02_FULL_37_18]OGH23110.1 MAG: hypothetical protein A3F31_03570 [Candidatus Levybacteria bacterium RIFCSPHIGHO2_12_FULL_38_12]OGH34564.1 MAG: hypothetical protein A3A47_00085 [Candidatus Levybacteria bacterium RIFCSPLOWO2_01_FULL_37_20]OGH43680.1 MAG: hypothetical protein A3J14_03740 [Candidatus Lev